MILTFLKILLKNTITTEFVLTDVIATITGDCISIITFFSQFGLGDAISTFLGDACRTVIRAHGPRITTPFAITYFRRPIDHRVSAHRTLTRIAIGRFSRART